jgi:hypothetical protein
MPIISSGGMVSTAYRIPRYVEPQIRYTAAKAATSPAVEGDLVETRSLLEVRAEAAA